MPGNRILEEKNMGTLWRQGSRGRLGKQISRPEYILGVTKGDREPLPIPNEI